MGSERRLPATGQLVSFFISFCSWLGGRAKACFFFFFWLGRKGGRSVIAPLLIGFWEGSTKEWPKRQSAHLAYTFLLALRLGSESDIAPVFDRLLTGCCKGALPSFLWRDLALGCLCKGAFFFFFGGVGGSVWLFTHVFVGGLMPIFWRVPRF